MLKYAEKQLTTPSSRWVSVMRTLVLMLSTQKNKIHNYQ